MRGGHARVRIAQVEEGGLLLRRPVRDGQRAHVTRHRLADLADVRQESVRTAEAVHAHDVRAGLLEALRGLDDAHAVGHLLERHGRQGEDDLEAAGLRDLQGGERLARVVEGLADDDVGALLDGPAHHLLEHRADLGLALRVRRIPDVGVRDVAGDQVTGAGVSDLARDCERRPVEGLQELLLADDPHLLAVAVVREGLDDVGAGALEVHVQGAQGLRELEGDLGDELAGGQVSPTLELEEESLRDDDGACVEALGEGGCGCDGHVCLLGCAPAGLRLDTAHPGGSQHRQ